MAKNLFSTQAASYAKYRPTYPKELFDHIIQFVKNKDAAWDCATGNGQAALVLAEHFKKVVATDISEKQLSFAKQHPGVEYRVSPAEKTGFEDNTFDLITVAQAYHWFQFNAFEKEVKRVGKKDGVIAIWGYSLMTANDAAVDKLVKRFYSDITGPYWDAERKYVDDNYKTVPFNFTPLPTRDFFINTQWSKNDLIGYFSSWSSVQHFIEAKKYDPVDEIIDELDRVWANDDVKNISFPLFLLLGRI